MNHKSWNGNLVTNLEDGCYDVYRRRYHTRDWLSLDWLTTGEPDRGAGGRAESTACTVPVPATTSGRLTGWPRYSILCLLLGRNYSIYNSYP